MTVPQNSNRIIEFAEQIKFVRCIRYCFSSVKRIIFLWRNAFFCGRIRKNFRGHARKETNGMKRQIDFTQGNIVRAIVLFSIPLIMGELLQNLYNSADAFVVGNLVDQNALAAVTVCGVISNMIVSFFNGMSVGSNVVAAKACGRGDWAQICRTVRVAYSFGVVLGVALSLLGVLLAPQLLHLAGTQADYFADALVYLRIYLAGLMFTVIYNNAAGILRALGRSDIPFRILLVSCVLNIALDLLFVGTFRMGIAGVGFATVLAQGVSVALVARAVGRLVQGCCFDPREMAREGGDVIAEVLRTGMSAGLQSALISLSNIFIVRYMNLFSTESVAGIGIAERLNRFVILPAKSFGITMTTYVAQNLGAGHRERLRAGLIRCMLVALGVTLSLTAVISLFTEQCVALFSPEPEVIAVGAATMRVMAPMFWVMAMREVMVGVLRGCGRNLVPMLLNLVGMIGVRQLYLAVMMGRGPAIEYIYYCYPIAWFATLLFIAFYYFAVRKSLLTPETDKADG